MTEPKQYEIVKGTTFKITATYLDPNDDPIDLTGAIAKMQFRFAPGDEGTPLFELNSSANTPLGSGIAIEPTLGILNIKITDEDTAKFNFKRATFNLIITLADGDKVELFKGDLKVDNAITI